MQKHEAPPCITVIISLEAQDRKGALQLIKQSIDEAAAHIKTAWSDQADKVVNALNALSSNYIYSPADIGIGLYVAPGYNELFRFSFPVQTHVSVGQQFAMRELLYQDQCEFDYLVLHLEEKTVQCYRGKMNQLEPVNNEQFPLVFSNEYEYDGDRKKDKTAAMGQRQKNFYKEADRLLDGYLHGQPLILSGPTKDIGYFEEVTRHKKEITATVHGNFSSVPLRNLEDQTWPAIRSFMELKDLEVVRELEDKGAKVVDGIREVLHAAKEGRGGKLLIEKDYKADAVEDAMRAVIDKHGEIVFVKEGVLEDHKHIALITRY